MAFVEKYRPQSFDDMVGNAATIKRLRNITRDQPGKPLDNNVLLFTGQTGCGKTTAARIVASLINEGDLSDQNFTELNGAIDRGIDTMRAIEEYAHLQPMHGHYRVYLIDECQDLTPQAMKALLKVLENVKPTTLFILCSNEPGKLPSTLVGRCSQFQFEFPTRDELKPLITSICSAEGMEMNKEVFDLVIKHSGGATRQFVQHLDAIAQMGAATTQDLAQVVTLYFRRNAVRNEAALAFLRADGITGRAAVLAEVDSGFDFTTTLLEVCANNLDKALGNDEMLTTIRDMVAGVLKSREQIQLLIGVDAKMILLANLA